MKLILILALVMLGWAGVAAGGGGEASRPYSWMFKADAARTGYVPVRAVKKPRLAWRTEVLGWVGAPPAVDEKAVYVVTNANRLYAFDRTDGKITWQRQLAEALPYMRDGNDEGKRLNAAGSLVAEGLVIVASNNGHLTAFEKSAGKKAWDLDTGHQIYAPPLYHAGKVYCRNYMNTAYCLEAASGKVLWKVDLTREKGVPPSGDGATPGGHSGFAWADGVLYAGLGVMLGTNSEGRLFSLEAATQKKGLWKPIFQCCEGTPAIAGGVLYYMDRENLIALDLKTGEDKWKTHVAFRLRRSSPVIHDGRLYIGGKGSPEPYRRNALKCVDARTGKTLWHHPAGGYIHSTPVVVDGAVYYCSTWGSTNRLYAVDPQTGKELWSWAPTTAMRRVEGGPAAADGAVYFGSGWENAGAAEQPWKGYVYAIVDAGG